MKVYSSGSLSSIRGGYQGALRELEQATAAYGTSPQYDPGTAVVLLHNVHLHLWKGDARSALAFARTACEDRLQRTDGRVYAWSAWLLGASLRALGDLTAAEEHLAEALTRCRTL